MNDRKDISDAGNGGASPMGADELKELFAKVSEIDRDAAGWRDDREKADAARLQVWPGQSPDGKQRREFLQEEPFPFDGSSDQRVLWADQEVRERVALFCVAAARAEVAVQPDGDVRPDAAWRATRMLRRMYGAADSGWGRAVELAALYAAADTPAVALVTVRFVRDRELETRRMDAAGLAALYAEMLVSDEGYEAETARLEAGALSDALADERAGEDGLAAALLARFDISDARARRTVRAIRRDGAAEFPAPGPWRDRLEFRALRFGEDFFIPDNTEDFGACPVWFEREWLSRAGVLARARSEGWDGAFRDGLLEHPGEGAFLSVDRDDGPRNAGGLLQADAERFQIVTAHYLAVDDDGIPGRYQCAFNTAVAGLTAYGRRLEDAFAARLFEGERIDQWALSGRGAPTVAGPMCGIVKGMRDDMADAGRLMALPPVAGDGYGNGREEDIDLSPLSYIPLKRGGRMGFLNGIQFPAHIQQALKDIRADRDEYFARPVDGVPREVSDTAREYRLWRWLGFLRDVLRDAVRLAVRGSGDEGLREIGGRDGIAPGGYGVTVTFDPATLDDERTIAKLKAVAELKQADPANVLDMAPVVALGVRALFPHHADAALRTRDAAAQTEDEGERDNYLAIRAGVMPRMAADGNWDYARRVRFYDDMLAANPAVFEDMGSDKRAMLEQWVKALQQQAVQFGENRDTGRSGSAGVEAE